MWFQKKVEELSPPPPKFIPAVWTKDSRHTIRALDHDPKQYDTEQEAFLAAKEAVNRASEWIEVGPVAIRRVDVVRWGAYSTTRFRAI